MKAVFGVKKIDIKILLETWNVSISIRNAIFQLVSKSLARIRKKKQVKIKPNKLGYVAMKFFKSNIEEATDFFTMFQEKDKIILKHLMALNLLMFADRNSIKKHPLSRNSRTGL